MVIFHSYVSLPEGMIYLWYSLVNIHKTMDNHGGFIMIRWYISNFCLVLWNILEPWNFVTFHSVGNNKPNWLKPPTSNLFIFVWISKFGHDIIIIYNYIYIYIDIPTFWLGRHIHSIDNRAERILSCWTVEAQCPKKRPTNMDRYMGL